MDLSQLTEFISPIILVGCCGIGYILHSLHNKIVDSFIPIAVATLGIIAAIWSLGTIDLNTVVTGMISGLAACGLYEAFKNMLNLPEAYAQAAITIPYGENENSLDKGKHF